MIKIEHAVLRSDLGEGRDFDVFPNLKDRTRLRGVGAVLQLVPPDGGLACRVNEKTVLVNKNKKGRGQRKTVGGSNGNEMKSDT